MLKIRGKLGIRRSRDEKAKRKRRNFPSTTTEDGVKLDGSGYIVANEDCRTNVEGIFTAGDCRTKTVRQLTTAASDGATAALAACEYLG